MVAMRVLTALLSVLLVSNARVIRPENVFRQPEFPSTNGRPEYPSTTEQPEYPSTTERLEYPSTTEEPEYLSTTEQPQYFTTEELQYSTTEEPQYPSTTEEPEYLSTTEEPEYLSTTEEPEYLSTTEEPQYSTTEEPQYPSTTEQPEYPYTPEEPEYLSTTEEPEYLSTSEEPEYASTTEEPQYPSQYPTTGDYFWNDNFTTDYNPQIFTVQCGISQDNVFYLDALENSQATFEISSNTSVNTNYSNNVDCRVQFITGTDPVAFSVVIEDLDLENSTSCNYDYLCIKGAKYCGKSSYSNYQYYVVPSSNTLTFKFHTDSSVTASGFRVNVYSLKTESYSSSYEPYGIIPNPNYIVNYHEVSQSNYVDYCNNEYDPVYYGTTPNYDQSTPGYYNSDRPYGGGERVIQCSSGNTESYYYLDSYSTDNNRYILRSDNFGNGTYSTNTNCNVKFYTSSQRQSLTVHYSSFDLESTSNCRWDSLCVNGVKYCSNWLQGSTNYYTIPAYSSFTVNFVTDGSVSASGFEAHLTFTNDYGSYSFYEATSGDGSARDTVEYSYIDIYNYQDRCASDYSSTPTSYYDEPSTTSEPHIDFGDSAILQSYVNVIKSNVDEAATRIDVVKDLLDSLSSVE